MKITDAAVCPFPNGDSSVRRFALEAAALGLDSLVAIDTPSATYGSVVVRNGVFLRKAGMKDVINQVKRGKDPSSVISVQAGDAGFNRGVVGLRGVHILRGVHAADKNAFDHVTAKMAADNRVAIDIDLSVLIAARGVTRQRAIQRYRDVLVLQRRFEFPLTLSSYARSVLDLRASREISGLCSLVGMDMYDVEKAFSGVDIVTATPEPSVRVVE
ncbi:RNase P subunit p30 family protein [Methanoregula sp.]|uniref:RNase P subunit p30 family protein n=1 Tax=Methanoregula sp. TaxID=2052170 RepID=UPI0023742938|nr:RNase P subunit p30 family protein [Methanoregula sp.]MDD1685584.1 ribonuclease P [Methanoregula sp.]